MLALPNTERSRRDVAIEKNNVAAKYNLIYDIISCYENQGNYDIIIKYYLLATFSF